MFRSFFVSLIGLTVLCISCKSDGPKKLSNDYAMLNQDDIKPGEIAKYRSTAIAALEFRYKETSKESITILDKDIWVYEGTVKNTDLTPMDSLGGRWIDFKEDLTYEYGSYSESKGKGRYHYGLEKGLLLLIDDNEMIKPQEFKLRALNDILVLEGSFIYKDNNLQAKLGRRATRPTEPK